MGHLKSIMRPHTKTHLKECGYFHLSTSKHIKGGNNAIVITFSQNIRKSQNRGPDATKSLTSHIRNLIGTWRTHYLRNTRTHPFVTHSSRARITQCRGRGDAILFAQRARILCKIDGRQETLNDCPVQLNVVTAQKFRRGNLRGNKVLLRALNRTDSPLLTAMGIFLTEDGGGRRVTSNTRNSLSFRSHLKK